MTREGSQARCPPEGFQCRRQPGKMGGTGTLEEGLAET